MRNHYKILILSNFHRRISRGNFSTSSNNVDSSDVQHLSNFSSVWWKKDDLMKGLHALNQIRVPFIRDGLISTGVVKTDLIQRADVLKGVKCLEIGCGAGILTESLARLKANVVGLEPSTSLVDVAQKHASKELQIQYICSTIEEHCLEHKDHYDCVICSEVLEHVVDKKSFLQASIETLKPGGSFFVTTFNKTTASLLGGVLVAEYFLKLLPQDTHDWNQFIAPAELESMLKDLNCQTVLVNGFRYEFWSNTMKWQKSTAINYALHAVKQ
jgi:polyprenyldihydroxybenzoate methyltransferase/3-demethylubiquinol 3-O-methyltransferase